jgi:hypothetical protein
VVVRSCRFVCLFVRVGLFICSCRLVCSCRSLVKWWFVHVGLFVCLFVCVDYFIRSFV